MSGSNLLKLSTILAFAVACSSDGTVGPPTGMAHAAATRECGPAGGPAVAIYLTRAPVESLEPPPPYVRIVVWHALETLEGRSWLVGGRDASGWFFSAANDFEFATSGRVTVNDVDADSTIHGSADLRFPNAGRVTGGFRAEWISRAQLCL
ncbi:MAG: hypothetical protein M3373_04185 [Gemmatimonadota bacterium]|nr:hypothetical protein [Gemmatimonadota bacterium]